MILEIALGVILAPILVAFVVAFIALFRFILAGVVILLLFTVALVSIGELNLQKERKKYDEQMRCTDSYCGLLEPVSAQR